MSVIYKLQKEHLPQYRDLRLRAVQTDPEAYFATYEELLHWPLHFFEAELLNGNNGPYGYYGYFDQMGKLRGYVNLAASYFSVQRHVSDLYNLYVQPEFRKQHIAQALLQQLLTSAQGAGLETIFLSVMSNNAPAVELYKQFGWCEYARKERSVKTPYHYLDEILMRRDLV